MALSAPCTLAFVKSSFMKWESSVATDTNDEVGETETRATDTTAKVAETETRPDLAWDDEVRGLCVRVHRDCAKLFIFVYRIGDRQRFIRIGQTPVWSLEAARIRAKELRCIVEQGRDPARENRGREIPPVENIVQYIAEHLRTKP
jgi:hypothetical protein